MEKARARPAVRSDAPAIAAIYNAGIDDRVATFETRHRSAAEIERWFDGRHPIVVVEEGDVVIAFASTSQYRPRPARPAALVAQGSAKIALQDVLPRRLLDVVIVERLLP